MCDIYATELYKGRVEYSSPFMEPFDFVNHNLILSQGPAYSGTTFQITKLIQANPTEYSSVVMISAKNSFKAKTDFAYIQEITKYHKFVAANNFVQDMSKINDIQYHCDGGGPIYDLMICDGIESILKIIRKDNKCLVLFMNAFQKFKRVIMTDTMVTQQTIGMLEYMKTKTLMQVHFTVNTYANTNTNTIPRNLHIIGKTGNPTKVPKIKNTFIASLMTSIKNNKKVCVVTSNKDLKDRIIMKSNSKNHIWQKENDQVLDETWVNPKFKLVICTVDDIDFEKAGVFDNVYVYAEDAADNALDILHMLKTVIRKMGDKIIYMACIKATCI